MEQKVPTLLEKLETLLKGNNGGDGWFVGDDVSTKQVNYFTFDRATHFIFLFIF